MGSEIRIIIIDDHEMVLQGLSALLSNHPGFSIVGKFTNGHIAAEQIHEINPDIVLTDINMPIINGFETAEKILKKNQTLKIIMISMEVKSAYIEKAKKEGIAAYVSKDSPIEKLVQVIKRVYLGQSDFELLKSA